MIYFITDGIYTKIGQSENVSRRLFELQTGNAHKLKVSIVISDAITTERKWHKIFSSYKTAADNEWFNITNEQINIELNKRFSQEQLTSYEKYTVECVGQNNFKSILDIKINTKTIKKIHNKLITTDVNEWLVNKKHSPITYEYLCNKFEMTVDEIKSILKKDNLLEKMMRHNSSYKKNIEIYRNRKEQLEYI